MTLHWERQVLLRPEDVPPSRSDWEVIGVFNPGVAVVDGQVMLLVRVAERPRERRAGYVALPRWDAAQGFLVDWVSESDVEAIDSRIVRIRSTGLVRLTFVSHLRLARHTPSATVAWVGDVRLEPSAEWEEFGVEDPRITRIGDRYWITYVAVSRHGAATALASTVDFRGFERHGIIFPPENKDVVLFPEQIGGHYVALHRPTTATPFSRPAMWLARSNDLLHWGRHEPLFAGESDWEDERVGAGPPPIRVVDGWLEIYHGNRRPARPGEVGCYQAAAMLLDADNPTRIRGRSVAPILAPSEPYEQSGFVPHVVFPTGVTLHDDTLAVYYGAGDTYTAVAKTSLRALIDQLQRL
ncbi:MAG TPA: glycoside hydrolase family 130 protein [Phycisphaerae bacterium]|nr:glycoside hydrolase family 130 protein [Phycisphaerae bacterium]HPU25311.1 glycoside hydrolase family 130 protein [Phycisphaerae bacterium]HQE29274.1 glycoside hydrolase family 130 protein [Phycisphaerae bacterium]